MLTFFRQDRRIDLCFTNSNFRYFLLSCILTTFGTGLSYIAFSWLILQSGGTVVDMAALMLWFWVPNALLGPLLGVIVDRYSRKKVILISNTIRGLFVLGFAFYLRHGMSITLVDWLYFVSGIVFGIYWPAVVALIREIVAPTDLLYANSAVDIAYEAGNMIGMGVAGLIMIWLKPIGAIVLNGMLFLLGVAALWVVSTQRDHTLSASKNTFFTDFFLGIRYLLGHKSLIIIYTVQLILLVTYMTAMILLAPFSKSVLHTSAVQFGEISAFMSVGAILGGMAIPFIAKKAGFWETLIFFCTVMMISFSVFPLNHYIPIAETLYFIIGFCNATWAVVVTESQRMTNPDYQGRMQSVFGSISSLVVVFMYVFMYFSGSKFSIDFLYDVEALISSLAIFLLIFYRKLFKNA